MGGCCQTSNLSITTTTTKLPAFLSVTCLQFNQQFKLKQYLKDWQKLRKNPYKLAIFCFFMSCESSHNHSNSSCNPMHGPVMNLCYFGNCTCTLNCLLSLFSKPAFAHFRNIWTLANSELVLRLQSRGKKLFTEKKPQRFYSENLKYCWNYYVTAVCCKIKAARVYMMRLLQQINGVSLLSRSSIIPNLLCFIQKCPIKWTVARSYCKIKLILTVFTANVVSNFNNITLYDDVSHTFLLIVLLQCFDTLIYCILWAQFE